MGAHDLHELAKQLGAAIEVDIGFKFSVAITPKLRGATKTVRVVHTRRGWALAAPRGSAMYGNFDTCGVSRRPLDSIKVLKPQIVAGGYAPSNIICCDEAKHLSRKLFRHKLRAPTYGASMLQGATSIRGPTTQHCLDFLLDSWTGRKPAQQFKSWECELSYWAQHFKPYASVGDDRALHEVLTAAYGVDFGTDGAVDFRSMDYRTVLVLMANLEASVVEVIEDASFGAERIGDDVHSSAGMKHFMSRGVKTATARAQRDLERIRRLMHPGSSLAVHTSRIHPLRSLSGLRATATGDYAVTVRVKAAHIEPVVVGSGYNKEFELSKDLFWGNAHVKVRADPTMIMVPRVNHISEPIIQQIRRVTILPDADNRSKPIAHALPNGHGLPRMLIAQQTLVVERFQQSVKLSLKGDYIRCRAIKSHRRMAGNKGPTACKICGTYEKMAYGSHSVLSIDTNGSTTTDDMTAEDLDRSTMVYYPHMKVDHAGYKRPSLTCYLERRHTGTHCMYVQEFQLRSGLADGHYAITGWEAREPTNLSTYTDNKAYGTDVRQARHGNRHGQVILTNNHDDVSEVTSVQVNRL